MLCMECGELVNHQFCIALWLWGCGTDYLDWLSWTGFLLRVFMIWWPLHIRDLETSVEDWYCGKMLVSLWFGLCGKKEMPKLFRIRRGLQRLFGIPFISLLTFRHLTQLSRAFPLMWFSLIGCWCVGPKVWASNERFCVLGLQCIGLFSILEVPFV